MRLYAAPMGRGRTCDHSLSNLVLFHSLFFSYIYLYIYILYFSLEELLVIYRIGEIEKKVRAKRAHLATV